MLKLNQINAHYGYIHALRDFSMTIPKGQIVTLLGANGAGKTTALKVISGVLRATSGSLLLEGEDMTSCSAEKRVARGIVQSPEGRQIFPEFTVLENLKVGAYTRKDKKNIEADLQKAYQYFPLLQQRKSQIAGTLSGGEQQMLAIARALMAKPKLLLLDEPSLGLAPLIVKGIFEIITEINKAGTTILLVEQNAFQALSVAHYAYILENGRIILEGEAGEIKRNEQVKMAYLGGH